MGSAVLMLFMAMAPWLGAAEWTGERTGDAADMEPRVVKKPYRHLLVLGDDFHVSKGSDSQSPVVAYLYHGENHRNPNLYTMFGLTTTRIYGVVAYRTNRIFTGVRPLLEHTTYGAWRIYNRGALDRGRSIKGNNIGLGAFFQYNWLRILATRVYLHPSYHFYRFPLVSPNVHKYQNIPHAHWQLKPGIETILTTVKQKDLNRVSHGAQLRVEYVYARRFGYGTWYDYDRLGFRERYDGVWATTTQGIWYRSSIRNTHRLYVAAGAYYAFAGDYNLLLDVYGGWFRGVDRNNAEQIGYNFADNAVMPGYYNTEFQHHFYTIARAQVGLPVPVWGTRLQPGFNVLYMPRTNEVVGLGRGAVTNPWLVRGYPRRVYTSVSFQFSTKLGNLLPLFIDYAYGIDALRTKSTTGVYRAMLKIKPLSRGNHEIRVMLVMGFGENKER